MKAEIKENKSGMDITLEPETKEEVAKLLRYSSNAKMEKPYVYMSFNNEPYCYIHLKKVKESVQNNFISKN